MKTLQKDFKRRQNRTQDHLDERNNSSVLRVTLFMCAQFLMTVIKDSLLKGKVNLKCSYTTCTCHIFTLIVLKRPFHIDDFFKRSDKFFFLCQNI